LKTRYGFSQYPPGYSEFANIVGVSPARAEKRLALKKRVKGAWNRIEPSHIGTVCRKEGFDDRLENVYEGTINLSY